MAAISNKIDFVVFVSANNCNPNGDPLNGNRPRSDFEGFGEISDVCIKRKIRNRMQDLGNPVFVQSNDRCDDKCGSLKERFDQSQIAKDSNFDPGEEARRACEKWIDVRSFGQVLAFKGKEKGAGGVSIAIRGPVSIRQATSCSPIDVNSMQITKSVNGEGEGKSSDTMGTKHLVSFGLYKIMGSINVQLAEKTGFSEDDAEVLKECLRTLFVNDASSARPDGSMDVVRFYWYKHKSKEGDYSSATVHKSIVATLKKGIDFPRSVEDYDFDETEWGKLEIGNGKRIV